MSDFQKQSNSYLGIKAFFLKKLQSFVIQHADVVIVPAEWMKPMAEKWGAKDVRVVYNGIDLEKVKEFKKK